MFRGRVRHVHFIGVGGIGMSGLAEILRTLEFDVSGSDLREGENTRALVRLGVRVDVGHRAENVKGADVVVYSSAIDHQNPEIQMARDPRHSGDQPRRDARRAHAREVRHRDRRLPRKDHDDLARRDRAPRRRLRSDGRRRRSHGGARIERASRCG
jgi:hypothetical protein